MQLTHEDRVKNGIKNLDIAAQKGKLAKTWRLRLDLTKLRIVDAVNNPLAQLFGTISRGLALTGTFEGGVKHGFIADRNIPKDAERLKKAWRYALRTDPKWRALGSYYTRVIRGLHFIIFTRGNHTQVKCQNDVYTFPAKYVSMDSAKRAVLKRMGRRP